VAVNLLLDDLNLIFFRFNPFQSNFSATCILPSSYLFWAGKSLVDYLSILHEEKRPTGSDSGAGEQTQQKKCRTSSDIGAEQEDHNVGRGPTLDRKGLSFKYCVCCWCSAHKSVTFVFCFPFPSQDLKEITQACYRCALSHVYCIPDYLKCHVFGAIFGHDAIYLSHPGSLFYVNMDISFS
jgi:hypothetical protein